MQMLPLSKKEAEEFNERRIQYAANEINSILKSKSLTLGGSDLAEKCIMMTLQRQPIGLWKDISERVLSDPQWAKYVNGIK